MKIDKSRFSAKELAQYEALIAKAVVPDDADVKKDDKPPEADTAPKPADNTGEIDKGLTESEPVIQPAESQKPVEKSALIPELAAALDRVKQLEKQFEMAQIAKSVKKYSILGEDENKLAEMLYNLKKSDEQNYNAYVAILDKQLDLIQKSGLFTEIGKSGNHAGCGSVTDKINAAAAELQKSDPNLDRASAINKAWEYHPELVKEYDAEYGV